MSADDKDSDQTIINFRIPKPIKKRFKLVAAMQGIQMQQLLQIAFADYVEKHKSELVGIV